MLFHRPWLNLSHCPLYLQIYYYILIFNPLQSNHSSSSYFGSLAIIGYGGSCSEWRTDMRICVHSSTLKYP